mmetsp:Transcript_28641/g.66387  ORF Transcript_28641/g.66387 Transcript_28641/m.66387 type:complete len:267 (-) Transcript_28641:90-890(-)
MNQPTMIERAKGHILWGKVELDDSSGSEREELGGKAPSTLALLEKCSRAASHLEEYLNRLSKKLPADGGDSAEAITQLLAQLDHIAVQQRMLRDALQAQSSAGGASLSPAGAFDMRSSPSSPPAESWSKRSADEGGLQEALRTTMAEHLDADSGSHGRRTSSSSELDKYPSLGSVPHMAGSCRPCHYVATKMGCRNGFQCGFCHYKHTKLPKAKPDASRHRPDDSVRSGVLPDSDAAGQGLPGEGSDPVPAAMFSPACFSAQQRLI